jgi:hypothetical protein
MTRKVVPSARGKICNGNRQLLRAEKKPVVNTQEIAIGIPIAFFSLRENSLKEKTCWDG